MLPEEFIVKDKSKVSLKLTYSPMTIEQETHVAGKVEGFQSGWQVQIRRADGHWQSGLVATSKWSFCINSAIIRKEIKFI